MATKVDLTNLSTVYGRDKNIACMSRLVKLSTPLKNCWPLKVNHEKTGSEALISSF